MSLPYVHFDPEDLARDMAMEIMVGGDRFDRGDVAELLGGISARDLDTLRERIVLYCRDFGPWTKEMFDYAAKEAVYWLSNVLTSEDDGSRKSLFGGKELHDDMWRFFIFDDGSERLCLRTDRKHFFTGEELSHLVDVKDVRQSASMIVSEILDFDREYNFSVPMVFPDGNVIAVGRPPMGLIDDINGENYFYTSGAVVIPVEEFLDRHAVSVMPRLASEYLQMQNLRHARQAREEMHMIDGEVEKVKGYYSGEDGLAPGVTIDDGGIHFKEPVIINYVGSGTEETLKVWDIVCFPKPGRPASVRDIELHCEFVTPDGRSDETLVPMSRLSDKAVDQIRCSVGKRHGLIPERYAQKAKDTHNRNIKRDI